MRSLKDLLGQLADPETRSRSLAGTVAAILPPTKLATGCARRWPGPRSAHRRGPGTVETPCGKVDCRGNCLAYLVSSVGETEDYALADCKISPLVSIN